MLNLPERRREAPDGHEFAARVAALSLAEREAEFRKQVLSGNVPGFMRRLCPVQVTHTVDGESHKGTFFATPDYLAVGSETDYFLMPISPGSAQALADALDCTLPTRKMVDEIYSAAEVKLAPLPVPPSSAMTTVAVFSNHNALVHRERMQQLEAHPPGALVAGHKKDVVIAAGLPASPGKLAIYGWHQTNGVPIQRLYLGHTASWVDYSQCVRLVSQTILVDGKPRQIRDVLAEPQLAGLLSDEGVLIQPRYPTNAASSSSTAIPAQMAIWHKGPGGSGKPESTAWFSENIAALNLPHGVTVQVNAPAGEGLF